MNTENQKSDVGFNREAYLQAIEIEDPIKSIRTYLEIVSVEDPQLKESLLSIDKSYEKCWQYIQSKAKEHLNNKSGHISPATIFGWAIHYFIENDTDLKTESKSVIIKDTKTNPVVSSNETASERMNRIKNQLKSLKNGD